MIFRPPMRDLTLQLPLNGRIVALDDVGCPSCLNQTV